LYKKQAAEYTFMGFLITPYQKPIKEFKV